jgi:hypothetical protein
MENDNNGLNFHKMIKGLSANALKYLINLASKELKKRNKNIYPSFENKTLPVLRFSISTFINIKNEIFNISSYTINKTVTFANSDETVLNLENYDWLNNPITITLTNCKNLEKMEIVLQSRSKIVWLNKLIEDRFVANVTNYTFLSQ